MQIAYNTKKSGKLLVSGDDALHDKLLGASSNTSKHNSQIDVQADLDLSEEAKQYIRSKIVWTREAALSYCKQMNTDFVSSIRDMQVVHLFLHTHNYLKC